MSDQRYRVKAAMAVVKTMCGLNWTTGTSGWTIAHLYQGQVLPPDVPAEQIRHLLDGNIIEPEGA